MKMRPIAVVVASMLLVALTAGTALAANINGTAGDDIIGPAPFNGVPLTDADTIRALDGNDTVDGFCGNDKVFGGIGDDTLIGAENNDNVKGEAGDDTIDLASFDTPPYSPPCTDTGPTTDRGVGGDGDDIFLAEDGNKDFINCGPGDDVVERFDDGLDVLSTTCEQ
jgi:Ca2+-binding RTX toxin-like protein